jgi:thymidylate synthase
VATVTEFETGREAYVHIVAAVRLGGAKRAPRGLPTYDLGHVTLLFHSPYDALPLGVGRKLNAAIGAAEAIQLVAGSVRHDLLPRISPAFSNFVEPTGKFHGAYGARVQNQVALALSKIEMDRDTRQAVVTLWNPSLDNLTGRRDYPCTIALNFCVVDDKLELRTLMRSNDAWLGLPYDIFQFTQLQLTTARALGVPPGTYTHETWSLHLYAEHADLVDQLTLPRDPGPYQPVGFGESGDPWHSCRLRAAQILHEEDLHAPAELTQSERWYRDQLAPYVRA